MKTFFFLPAVAIASSNWGGGNVGENYAQDYTIADSGTGFQCDIDGNATYTFSITSDNGFIREVKMQGTTDCDFTAASSELDITDGGKTATVDLSNICFDGPTADKESHDGVFEVYISADEKQDLFFGKVWQNMKCTMKRDHKVEYEFTQIMLDVESEGDLSDGEKHGYVLSRRKEDGTNMTDDTKNVTSGETLYFQINAVGRYEDFDFDIKACSVNKDTDTYYLAALYPVTGVDYCVDTFLATTFSKNRDGGYWSFSYEAFTFKTANQSKVTLTCDVHACEKDESEANGWCPGMKPNCEGTATKLVDDVDPCAGLSNLNSHGVCDAVFDKDKNNVCVQNPGAWLYCHYNCCLGHGRSPSTAGLSKQHFIDMNSPELLQYFD